MEMKPSPDEIDLCVSQLNVEMIQEQITQSAHNMSMLKKTTWSANPKKFHLKYNAPQAKLQLPAKAFSVLQKKSKGKLARFKFGLVKSNSIEEYNKIITKIYHYNQEQELGVTIHQPSSNDFKIMALILINMEKAQKNKNPNIKNIYKMYQQSYPEIHSQFLEIKDKL